MTEHLDEAQAVLREYNFFDFPTPWIGGTAKACQEHGPYADYSAWENWMLEHCEGECLGDAVSCKQTGGMSDCGRCILSMWWENMEAIPKANLYAAMSDACRATAEALGWKDKS
jgi:transcription elongation factor Elf1